ncbi:type I polyketide synthase [Mariniblastus fucicola]|uniref:Polyketide synthase PksJ n=1 Tax=Mariniblastus fucicola TaxID=980251 RepID=A0A5B9PHK7_9BACT|nr:type I polyketide synthase [Mariniblastus fucicola]QEG22143.1 Polyketide synthase PksJ [Mariniblastus fucicola]
MNTEAFYKQINDLTAREFPDVSLNELIEQTCKRFPDSIATLDAKRQLTYAELDERSSQLAAWLNENKGIKRGDLVGVCCDRNAETPVLLLGILKAGAGYVPLDPDYPFERLAYMVEDSKIKHVVAHSGQLNLTESFDVPATIVDRDWEQIASTTQSTEATSKPTDPQSDVAYVIYTSGSTGKPKGVAVPHRSVVNMLFSMIESPGFTQGDRILATTTLSFDISVAEMFLPLITGGSVAVIDRQSAKDTTALVAAIENFDVTFMQATPAMWRMIVEADFPGKPTMKFITAGEPLPRDLIQPMLNRCGEVWNLYGPTETTVYSSGTRITSDTGRILIGAPIANTQVYVVDENDDLCPPETEGELLIAGAGMTLGYLNRPELNAEKFVQWNGVQVYRTGDLAKMTIDGQIDHLGRIDDQIKFNGHRIELGEIDAAMAMQPGVRQAATVLREDRPGDPRLVGYLLAAEDETPNVAEIRRILSMLLPDYMVPNIIAIVDQFQYTPSGKLDRKAFDPPSTARPDLGVEYAAPKTDEERKLSKLWSEVLQIDRIGLRDNFFELGGNSIRAVKLVATVKKELGIDITGAEFFDNPTIESFVGLREKKQRFKNGLSQNASRRDTSSNQYAIVGMAARMPGARDLNEFWSNLVNGVESIRFFTPEELDDTLDPSETQDANYVAARGIIEDADHFDAKFFRTPPRTAEMTCPQQRIMLELAWTALEDAGVIPNRTDDQIGIWAGTYSTSYFIKNVLTNPDLVRQTGEFQAGVLNEKDYIATRVAHALNFTGPAINVNTACSTSLVALIEACKSLEFGHCDVALAGAASVTFPQNSGHLHQTGSIFSPDGHCRPFDADGAGTLFSDGAGVVVVKRLEDAVASEDRIYAVIKGFGINNDGGEKASFSAPSIHGQANAIAMAQSMAGVNPDSIGYIEAHGTATPIGDPIEVSALRTVFESQTDEKQFCAIGSVKSNFGHTVSAAGIAGLIKSAMALHDEQIPATLHFQRPNPQIDFENSPFFVCDKLTPWKRVEQPRRAGVSAFGVGGTNAHVLLEEAPTTGINSPATTPDNELPFVIFPVSAKSESALVENVDALAKYFASNDQCSIAHAASTLQTRREEFAWRAAVVVDSASQAATQLTEKKPPQFMKRKSTASGRDIVFMFPGQGSQYVRMGQNLYQHSTVFRESLDQCAAILNPLLDRDLLAVLFPKSGDEEASQEILRNTQFTQPALFALEYSLAKVWKSWGVEPKALIGHSIGEFAAACAAEVFKLEDGLRMIAKRGQLMQALPGGSMMSVRLPGNVVEPLLWGQMAIGSFNGPSLCVVAGPDDQVAELQSKLEADEVVCRHLHTSHAFHSPMMEEIVEPFAKFVEQFELSPPTTPILSTVTGGWMTNEEATDPNYWADHLRKPVRFSDAVTKLWDEKDGDPSRILIELGPRRTLATLAKQHATDPKKQISIPTLGNNADDNAEWHSTLSAVANLWLAGVKIDWSRLSSDGQPRRKLPHMSLPTYAFQRERYFIKPGTVPESSNTQIQTQPQPAPKKQDAPPLENSTMTRIPNIVTAINEVFENTSGFDLSEFDGDTTFFEMGLDSLVLTQTATALKKEMNFEVTFRQLLEETPTVDSLALFLDENLPADQFAAVEVNKPANLETPVEVTAISSASDQLSDQPEPSIAVTQQENETPIATSTAAKNVAPVVGSAAEAIVQQQLQIMAAQLQMLSGFTSTSSQTAPSPKAVSTPIVATSVHSAAESKPAMPATPLPTQSERPEQCDTAKAKRFSTIKLNDGALNESQQSALDEIIRQNNAKMPNSKAYAQLHRKYMADPRTVSGFRPNMKEMTHPIVVERSKGVKLWDIDGNEYIDFTCGFGSNILGHSHEITIKAITDQVNKDYSIGPQSPLAGEVAKLFCELTGNERMAFSNTGSEAVLGCTRLARNATGRDLIVMFNGDYHGILDEVIARGSKKLKSFPAATGIPKDHVGNTLILDYGDPKSLEIIRERMDEIAAVLVEPVQSRTPELQPKEFLQELRAMTENEPTCLIFDEVISGLRIGLGGAQEYFGIKADLASYGKIVGGGMPIGIVAGKAEYMDGLDGGYWQYGDDSRPESGMTYFAGTFVRHPLTLAASKAILEHLRDGGQPMYESLNGLGDYLADKLNQVFEEMDAPMYLANFGSLFKIQFHQELVYSEVFFAGLRRRGMHIWDHRPCLLTLAHQRSDVDRLADEMRRTIAECQRYGFMPGEGHLKFVDDFDANRPPASGAKIGKDENGNPGWFVADTNNPGQFVQIGFAMPGTV